MSIPTATLPAVARPNFVDLPGELVLKIAGTCVAIEAADSSHEWSFLKAMRALPRLHEDILNLYRREYKRLLAHSIREGLEYSWADFPHVRHFEIVPSFTPE